MKIEIGDGMAETMLRMEKEADVSDFTWAAFSHIFTAAIREAKERAKKPQLPEELAALEAASVPNLLHKINDLIRYLKAKETP